MLIEISGPGIVMGFNTILDIKYVVEILFIRLRRWKDFFAVGRARGNFMNGIHLPVVLFIAVAKPFIIGLTKIVAITNFIIRLSSIAAMEKWNLEGGLGLSAGSNVTIPLHNIAVLEKWNRVAGVGISVGTNVTIPLYKDAVIIKYMTLLHRVVVWYMREIKNIPLHHLGRSG